MFVLALFNSSLTACHAVDMANSATKSLSDLVQCNLHAIHSADKDSLLQFAFDYFDDELMDSDDEKDEDDDTIEKELVVLPDAPELVDLVSELDQLEQESDEAAHYSETEENEEAEQTNVLIDEAELVLDPVADTVVCLNSEQERERIRNFNCGCSGFKAGRCLQQFDEDYVERVRMYVQALTVHEKDMFIMGKVSCTLNISKYTEMKKKKNQVERQRW